MKSVANINVISWCYSQLLRQCRNSGYKSRDLWFSTPTTSYLQVFNMAFQRIFASLIERER